MAIFPVISKRLISRSSVLAACVMAALFLVQCTGGGDSAIFVQAPLPYSQDALAPFISADTMGFHYDKHYAGYVKKANTLTGGIGYAGKTAEDVIRMTAGDASKAAIFNNAAQAWNHAYFFKCMKPGGGGAPEGLLAEMIDASFGSFVDFKELFITAAKDQFGSGWVWLVLEDDRLAVVAGANADTPLAHDLKPLFTVDVWEHAYYLDYQNRRVEFVKTVLDNLANWEFVAAQLEKTRPAEG
jgi:superoxide dismutase, Fe-Mn family